MSPLRIVLGSASRRRLELLRQIGLEPEVRPPDVVERGRPGESAIARVERLAEEKGREVELGLARSQPALIVAADTVVVAGTAILGKPSTQEEAAGMLRTLAGRSHDVLTGVIAIRTDDGRASVRTERTRVRFRAFDETLIRWYVATGEPMDKAGAYGIQGRGVLLVEGIEGSWTNVVGFPIERLDGLLREIGINLLDLLPQAAEEGNGISSP